MCLYLVYSLKDSSATDKKPITKMDVRLQQLMQEMKTELKATNEEVVNRLKRNEDQIQGNYGRRKK